MTAVFPTRFPVPTTAIDGSSKASRAGGSNRKSAPSYGNAPREDPAREREALDRPEHGLVGEIDDDVGSVLVNPGVEVVARAGRRIPLRL